MSSKHNIRCPYCLSRQVSTDSKVKCKRCKKKFNLERAIVDTNQSLTVAKLPFSEIKEKNIFIGFFLFAALLATNYSLYDGIHEYNGKDFIWIYIGLLLFSLFLRRTILSNRVLLVLFFSCLLAQSG